MFTKLIYVSVAALVLSQILVVIASPYVITFEGTDDTTTTARPLLGRKQCTYGPAYWCHNITQAKQCGAMKHCIKKVWEPMVLPEDNDDVCTICKDMVKQARDQLLSNETQDELRQVLEGSCNLIPLKIIAKECSEFMDEFIPELIDALASRMDPEVVCAVSGLCNSLRIDEMLGEMKDIDLDGNTILQSSTSRQPFDLSKDSCPKCTHFVGKGVEYFRNLKKEELKDKLFEICGHLGSYSDSCRGIVMKEFEPIYNHIQNEMNSVEMCGLVGLCSVVSIHPVKLETSSSSVRVWSPPVNDDELECEFCKQMVNYLRNWLTSDTTKEEFKKVIKGLCKQTGKYSKECLNLAEEYSGPLYQLLIDECDPVAVCRRLEQCVDPTGKTKLFGSPSNSGPIWTLFAVNESSIDLQAKELTAGEKISGDDEKNSHRPDFVYPMMKLTPGEKLTGEDEMNALSTDTTLCKICTEIALEAQKYLRKHLNATEDELAKYVNKFCDIFMEPAEASKCHEIVEKYGLAFMKTVVDYLNPDFACTEIKICPEPTLMVEEVAVAQAIKDIPTCSICTFTVTKLIDMIGKNRSKEAIDSAVEGVCYILPKSYESRCLTFMKEYGDRVIEMILIEGSAHEICFALRLCWFSSTPTTIAPTKIIGNSFLPFDRYFPQSMIGSAMAKLKEYPYIETHLESAIDNYNKRGKDANDQEKPGCALCEFVITQLSNQLGNNATEEEIKNSVEHICDYLPKTLVSECKGFVEQYGELVITYLVQSLDPREICTELRICESTITNEIQQIQLIEYPMSLQLNECELCMILSDYLEAFLADPKVDISMEKLAEKICPLLKSHSTECVTMIEDYGPYLISLLTQEVDKGKACAQVNLCPSE